MNQNYPHQHIMFSMEPIKTLAFIPGCQFANVDSISKVNLISPKRYFIRDTSNDVLHLKRDITLEPRYFIRGISNEIFHFNRGISYE